MYSQGNPGLNQSTNQPIIDVDEFKKNMGDAAWRLSHLYKITNKQKKVVLFKPNDAQIKLFRNMHSRNVIPKARQRGLSTAIQLLILDTALFCANTNHKVTAQDLPSATEIFNQKIKFAYDNLHPFIKKLIPLTKKTESALTFSNGSTITVSTSARSGTLSILHVSEFGKISAESDYKAKEIMTGSIPAVPSTGKVFVESTSAGAEGEFYDMTMRALRFQESNKQLTPLNFKLHFFSWWDADEYELYNEDIVIPKKDNAYFASLEQSLKIVISKAKRRWYVVTRDEFGTDELMWQEYPSTVEEAFKTSMEGTYYSQQFTDARKQNRITQVPYDPSLPVSTYWDIGANDETSIWCIQHKKHSHNVINCTEASAEPFSFFVDWLKSLGYTYEKHHLPHDGTHKRQLGMRNMSAEEMLMELSPGWRFEIVPRIEKVIVGIQQTRNVFPLCYFDEENCREGLHSLEIYRKEWDKRRGVWKDEPLHSPASNYADAFRGFGQQVSNSMVIDTRKKHKPRVSSDWRM